MSDPTTLQQTHNPQQELKTCSQCGESFPATSVYFSQKGDRGGRLRSECKKCEKRNRRRHYELHGDVIRQRNNERRDRADSEKRRLMAEQQLAWRERNREYLKAYKQRYYQSHRGELAQKNKRYKMAWNQKPENKQKERERMRLRRLDPAYREKEKAYRRSLRGRFSQVVRKQKRRALESVARGEHTAADIQKLYENQHGLCWWCQKRLKGEFHVDHRIPLSRGGTNDISNLVIACPQCNMSKGAKLPHEWNGRLL